MTFLPTLANAPLTLWLVLAWPSLPLVFDLFENNRYYAEIMSITGVFSVQLLVLTLAITPVMLLTKRWPWAQKTSRWFLRRRRYFGVASFGYALLHVVFYVREVNSFKSIYLEAFDIAFTVGWLGFLIMIPLALTSNDTSVRFMGVKWKALQRGVYPAVIAIFIHWFFFDFFWDDVLIWSVLLVVLKSVHIAYRVWQKRPKQTSLTAPESR